ncbi:HXXEE domain-containing protein [Nannocystis punicea]|uniref:HXXEE domain-containing protein n=1 Tax=Nannocystis punicea TaxID=2995304 RepID=A0ABY7GWB9_9BACT|nr:HXXEE domain-containing protein [Nannocystis poenicansa]WAS91257.1 HXXEE domain-containing protein [Nannocystis poenicansa]
MELFLRGWPFVGLGLALVLVVWLALPRPAARGPRWHDPAWVLALLWPMYLVHQFEEHGIDLLGRRYAFLAELCRTLGYGGDLAHCPADEAAMCAVNVGGCQIAFVTAWVFRRRNPLVAACAWGVPLINGLIHIGSSLAQRAYGPGLLTSVVLFLPLSLWALRTAVRAGVIRPAQCVWVVVTGVLMHAILMASLLLVGRGLLSHEAMLAINVLNGFLPLLIGLWVGGRSRSTSSSTCRV